MQVPLRLLVSLAPPPVRAGHNAAAPRCRLCGSEDTRPVCVSTTVVGLVAAVCRSCGIVFTGGSSKDAAEKSQYEVYWASVEADAICRPNQEITASRRAHLERQLGRPVAALRVLEVGVGRGEFAAELSQHGALVTGIDPDRRMAELVANRLSIRVVPTLFDDFDPGTDRYDLVNFSHVLEHLSDPVAALRRAATLLAPGGAISIEVPNATVLAGGQLERFFFDECTHLYHFTAQTLQRVAAAAGLTLAGAEPAYDGWWGHDCALRAVARPGAEVQPLSGAPAQDPDEMFQHMLAQQAAWLGYRQPVRRVRSQLGRVAKRVLPAAMIARLRAIRLPGR